MPMPSVGYEMLRPITATEPWRSLAIGNTPDALPADIPVFLAQGTADTTIYPAVTEAYRQRLCGNGNAVHRVLRPGIEHRMIAHEVAGQAVDWLAGRFAGQPAPDDC